MNLESILTSPSLTPQKTQIGPGAGSKSDFSSVLKDAIKDVNRMQNDSDTKIGSLLKGESQDIHGTILAVQQADTSFKLMMQVRNKIVEAYKEISRSGM